MGSFSKILLTFQVSLNLSPKNPKSYNLKQTNMPNLIPKNQRRYVVIFILEQTNMLGTEGQQTTS